MEYGARMMNWFLDAFRMYDKAEEQAGKNGEDYKFVRHGSYDL